MWGNACIAPACAIRLIPDLGIDLVELPRTLDSDVFGWIEFQSFRLDLALPHVWTSHIFLMIVDTSHYIGCRYMNRFLFVEQFCVFTCSLPRNWLPRMPCECHCIIPKSKENVCAASMSPYLTLSCRIWLFTTILFILNLFEPCLTVSSNYTEVPNGFATFPLHGMSLAVCLNMNSEPPTNVSEFWTS